MTVRRTQQNIERYELGSLRLYREDLHAIATAVAEAGDLAMTCDGFEATSPDDFSDALPEKLKNVTITAERTGSSSSIEVRLSADEASVQLVDPDTLLAGIVSRIRLICEPGRRTLRSLLVRRGRSSNSGSSGSAVVTISTALIGAAAVIIAAVFTELAARTNNATHATHNTSGWNVADTVIVAIIGGVVILGTVGYVIFALGSPWAVMINAPRADRPTYWQRTRDT